MMKIKCFDYERDSDEHNLLMALWMRFAFGIAFDEHEIEKRDLKMQIAPIIPCDFKTGFKIIHESHRHALTSSASSIFLSVAK